MKLRFSIIIVVFWLSPISVLVPMVGADPVDLSNLTADQQKLLDEYICGRMPGNEDIYIRKGYILSYNPTTKTPDWVAYHV